MSIYVPASLATCRSLQHKYVLYMWTTSDIVAIWIRMKLTTQAPSLDRRREKCFDEWGERRESWIVIIVCNPHSLHFQSILFHILDTVGFFTVVVYVSLANQRMIVDQRYSSDRSFVKLLDRFTTAAPSTVCGQILPITQHKPRLHMTDHRNPFSILETAGALDRNVSFHPTAHPLYFQFRIRLRPDNFAVFCK